MKTENKLLQYGGKDEGVLKRFMDEFFPFKEFLASGFFTKEMKGNYYLQAERVCVFFDFKSVFEYGAMEVTAHITGSEDSFLTTTENIYQ